MKKKLLMLGGAHSQIPAIKKAKEMGHYVIICDYLEQSPGHRYADESHLVSTTDKESVLSLARSLKIDGIVSYESEAAAPTAAFVAEQLGLPSNPYRSVEILTNKDLFRAFLRENNFNVPQAKGYHSVEEAREDFRNFEMPVMIKPVDSSGSRGVSKIDSIDQLQEKAEYALSYSRAKRFIVEEYIEKCGYQVGGDGFSVDGELLFRCFSNEHFGLGSINSFVPVGSSFPCSKSKLLQNKIHAEIQKVLTLLNMRTGAYNFDILVDVHERVYLLEIAARNGGDWMPQTTKYATGVDMIDYTIKAALGEEIKDLKMVHPKGYWSSYVINSQNYGIFEGIEIHKEINSNSIVEYELLVNPGDSIMPLTGANKKIGTMILNYSTMSDMLDKMDNMFGYVKTIVENSLVNTRRG